MVMEFEAGQGDDDEVGGGGGGAIDEDSGYEQGSGGDD